jgi:hypothetical protein
MMPKRTKKQTIRSFLLNAIVGAVVIILFYVVLTTLLSGMAYLAYGAGIVGASTFTSLIYVASLLPLSLSVFLYLRTYKAIGTALIPKKLGFGLGSFSFKNVGIGLMIFVVIICLELIVGLLSVLTNVQINTNVGSVFSGAPAWFLIFASLIEPINEEIFFRGFLVPRLGVLPSAVIFGLAHYSYNSTYGIEMIAAFIFGAISGYVYKRTGSIYPGIVAHILINSIAALSFVGS